MADRHDPRNANVLVVPDEPEKTGQDEEQPDAAVRAARPGDQSGRHKGESDQQVEEMVLGYVALDREVLPAHSEREAGGPQ